MAKSESKSGWEAVKPTKTKPKAAEKTDLKSKSPPKAKIVANTSPKENQKSKPDKKKAPSKPAKKPFEIKDGELDKMAGSATGTLANLNCLNYLTAEFTAPERIPPYDKEAEDFPSSKLSPKHKERVEKILSSLQEPDSRTQFLKVLINNMISASRQAENAWGARAMGQMLMKKYPELSCVQSDVLGTETHPGAVLSIIWMFTRVKEFKSLMSVLFWLVLPRLKQKKIAEYLPKLLGDIELSIKNQGGQVQFSKSHIAHLVFCLDDTKLTKPVMSVLGSFFNSIRPRLEPDHTWIESFIPLLTSATKRHSLPIILKAIEADPAKAAQELKRLSDDNRLQVDLIVDSCPETTLTQKYRDIIASKLNEPMATSDEIRKTKRNNKKITTTSGAVQQTTSGSAKSAGFVSSLVKILVYSSILIGLSSQFETTRPIYKEYAHPYVATYVQPVVSEYIAPKYEEFVDPHVKTHLIPAYNQYLSPHLIKIKTLWTENGAPLLLQAISETEKLYSKHLAGHVNKIAESAGPVLQQVRRDGVAIIQSIRDSNKDLFSGWEKKSESILEDFRAYVAIAGIECRRLIDLGSQKGSEWLILAKETSSDWLIKAQDMASNGSSEGIDKAKIILSEAATKAQNGIQIGLSEGNKLIILAIQKTSVYYQQFLDATVDQRAMAIEKGQVGLDWLKVQSTEVIRLADEYKISEYLENGFEMCGRSMIWLGDMMAEVAGMRTCCLKKRFRTLWRDVNEYGEILTKKLK